MEQVTRNLGLQLGGITDEPSLIPNMVSNMIKIDEAIGQGSADPVARAAAATAQETADQASEDATGAMELAQQAIASGLKFKRLSSDEVSSILNINTSYSNGLGRVIGAEAYSKRKSYVLNITPRIKLVSIGKVIHIDNQLFALNTEYILRSGVPTIEGASWSIFTSIDCIPVLSCEGGFSDSIHKVTFQSSSTPTIGASEIIVFRLNGIIQYSEDIDLGTDIA